MTQIIEERGEVALQLAGEEFRLVPSYRNLAAIEAALGMGITSLLARWQTGDVQLTHLAKIIAAAAEPMQPSPPGTTRWSEERIGAALLAGDMPAAITVLLRFLAGALNAGAEDTAEATDDVREGGAAPGKRNPRRKKQG